MPRPDRISGIFFLPSMAIARVGSSDTPVEAYQWSTGTSSHSGTQTVVRPALSFQVADDGSIRPYLPTSITFKEQDGSIRPVAPFFELWVTFQSTEDGSLYDRPLTIEALNQRGLSLQHLWIRVTAANRKAQRRTGTPACSFSARAEIRGADFTPHPLLACSPCTRGQTPLVSPEHPIPLGKIQLIRPVNQHLTVGGDVVDCSVVRLRFTPAKGKVYGPPNMVKAPSNPLQPGQWMPPAWEYGRMHEVTAPENRILNPDTLWSQFVMFTGEFPDTLPFDSYDGANVGSGISSGTVDDTCDALIEATLVGGVTRHYAAARVFVGPPDYAPDRRPFFTIADDLADRDLPDPVITPESYEEAKAEVLSILRRAFDTASLFNLDAARTRALEENDMWVALAGDASMPRTEENALWLTMSGGPPLTKSDESPKLDGRSFTEHDTPYVDKSPPLLKGEPTESVLSKTSHAESLPYSRVAPFAHGQMMEEAILIDFLRRRGDHVRKVIRPPFARWDEMPDQPPQSRREDRRDPRLFRDRLHDMRMPPYMRDSNFYPLSITRRQYLTVMRFIDYLEQQDSRAQAAGGQA